MKKVYLIRHGLPDFPGGERMCLGTTDLPMGEEGKRQAEEMARMLPPVTDVFSSPMFRAVQTAEAIGLPVTILHGLRELHAGEWDGLTFREIRERYPALYDARGTDKTLPLPGEEPPELGLIRFSCAIHAAAEAAGGDFAVVAHGGILAHFIRSLGGPWRKPGYAQIITLAYENGNFRIWEETDHA